MDILHFVKVVKKWTVSGEFLYFILLKLLFLFITNFFSSDFGNKDTGKHICKVVVIILVHYML